MHKTCVTKHSIPVLKISLNECHLNKHRKKHLFYPYFLSPYPIILYDTPLPKIDTYKETTVG